MSQEEVAYGPSLQLEEVIVGSEDEGPSLEEWIEQGRPKVYVEQFSMEQRGRLCSIYSEITEGWVRVVYNGQQFEGRRWVKFKDENDSVVVWGGEDIPEGVEPFIPYIYSDRHEFPSNVPGNTLVMKRGELSRVTGPANHVEDEFGKDIIPVNDKLILKRLYEILDGEATNSLSVLMEREEDSERVTEVKTRIQKLMWFLNAHVHGEAAHIGMCDLYEMLTMPKHP